MLSRTSLRLPFSPATAGAEREAGEKLSVRLLFKGEESADANVGEAAFSSKVKAWAGARSRVGILGTRPPPPPSPPSTTSMCAY